MIVLFDWEFVFRPCLFLNQSCLCSCNMLEPNIMLDFWFDGFDIGGIWPMSLIETAKYCQACYYLAYWLGISRGFVMNLIWSVAPVNLQLIPRSSLLHASMINTSNSHPSNTLTCVNTTQEQACWVTFSGCIYASDLASLGKKNNSKSVF